MVDLVFGASPVTRSEQQPQLAESVAVQEGTPGHVDHRPGCRQEGDMAASVVQGSPELWERQGTHRGKPWSLSPFSHSHTAPVLVHSRYSGLVVVTSH